MNAPRLPGRIEHWPLARLRPYARNAKTHDADQVAKIAASMAEFGWTVPVLVAADGELIAGHGRILAAAQLGLAEAPVIVLGHLTEGQRRAYRIADNKLTELGGWDEALLLEDAQRLATDGAGERGAAERRAVLARREQAHDVARAHGGADGVDPAAERLAHCHEVRLDALVLEAEPAPRAPERSCQSSNVANITAASAWLQKVISALTRGEL